VDLIKFRKKKIDKIIEKMFGSAATAVYSTLYPARSICSQVHSKEKHRFIVGTCGVNEQNQINVLEYKEDINAIELAAAYQHPHMVSVVESCFYDSSVIATAAMAVNGDKDIKLYRMALQSIDNIENGTAINDKVDDLVELSNIPIWDEQVDIHSIKWNTLNENQLLLGGTNSIGIYNNETNTNTKLISSVILDSNRANATCVGGSACWDPHAASNIAATSHHSLFFIDSRKNECSNRVINAHDGVIRAADYNPNKPFTLVTAGDDRKIKFWDARNLTNPLNVLGGHSHWVWTAKYNPFHDQLLVSGGSDNIVNLWRIASCSSAPWLSSTTTDSQEAGPVTDGSDDPPDVKVRAIDSHEDSVYSVAWSPADAWLFCSLSFDGRVLLHNVPSTEKYKILL
jgi:WD40 repeat protein